ncbi:hypothetical protein AGABI1DRAFT_86313 [Agaricus bisporus var. burnettii JB137-S8]|uniref:Hemerythrin-like domain-containing protein n=1 Tax=Agaricus bisporus var. burnettii (strain JB137-S8 / ATCC MYA-4627 / FGSC 10392) TaxID=597362 RepID=K5XT30_AGABU|nr:uncharacterized protein AGABI1DRAFT_86313 [Agaricus bisporus var. burnettii JB137-S8]EKM78145.1 hypothetical protein AGABI1DRAFT_86313 [Agaricus bisporus var. burnettii JB137-S8]
MSFPTDPFEQLHYNMVRAHQTFKLGYDAILKNLENNQEAIKSDLTNFLGYCQAWVISIDTHHDSEEEIVFPFLNQKMDFEPEKEAHKVIHKGLSDITAIVTQFKADPSKFDPDHLKENLVKLKDPLFEHLDVEVEHIKSSKLKEVGFGDAELKDLNQRLDKYAQSHGDPFLVVPYMRSHTPPELKNVWPPMPWVLRKVVIPYVLAWKHSGYWKYAPYSVS